ncbi:MAG: FTR1 family iron permease [Synergistaceae bacterium]|jgi:high-affinity iron transporter|nr:FTR1 family iron permease [Synergistaceae bacterium]
MRRSFVLIRLVLICLTVLISPYAAEAAQYASWNEIIDQMHKSLDGAYEAYLKQDADGGKTLVNDAYYGYYEKEGVERMVMSFISGKRATTVEYQFSVIKQQMTDGASSEAVRASIDELKKMLREDANQLDGTEDGGEPEAESQYATFFMSLVIILREGFEAILVIAAIATYLIRSGNMRQVRIVYLSSVAALGASVVAAVVITYFVSGANQEILEGVAMLLAVVVLFFVSNWMVSKAEAEAWKHYIEGKVQTAVETGSSFALGAAAFLAVFREGAETILFYQAMLARVQIHKNMVWAGFFVGCIALVFIFALVRYGSLVIPIKQFFMGTSILMYIMCVAFAGGGVRELQEADVVSAHRVEFVDAIIQSTNFPLDMLGIYPYVETLLPQAVLLFVAIFSMFHYRAKGRRERTMSV